MRVIRAEDPLKSPARVEPTTRPPFRVAAVQHRWHRDPTEHRGAIADGVRLAATDGAQLICLMELTLSPYFAVDPTGPGAAVLGVRVEPESLLGGPTHEFAAGLAAETGVPVHASLYERADDGGLGYNTAICVAPTGELLARTRKMHLPVTEGYFEDRWFRPGDGDYRPARVGPAQVGFPTCWDQWFPEVARAYSLAGAEVIVYPTAIGSEPDHPHFDTQPLWERVITANGIANGTFMVVINRIGDEGRVQFYGSSFISDPYGRVLVRALRDEPCVLIADLDLDQRHDWLDLFPLLRTRRPDSYGALTSTSEERRGLRASG
ncbi:MAG: nitrilase-related carbon-nitrogen hydrolase [Acidimicrobiia bacterium]